MKNKYYLLFLFIIGFNSIVNAQLPKEYADKLQNVLDSVSKKYNMKGISAAVLVPGAGVWKGTYGESHKGKPLTSDMLFCMGSNTKTHICALLLKMQEQNLIDLDDTIGKWITGYPNITGSATIRQCLNHSSGIADYFQNENINDSIFGKPDKIWKHEELLKIAAQPDFSPGMNWNYSNTNYIIAGIIIEKVLNKSPFEAMNEMLLHPNGLKNTFNFGEQPSNSVIAHPWTMNLTGNSLTDITTTPYLNQLFSLATTAGGLMTTAEENVYFWHKLYKGELINADSWKEMTTFIKLNTSDSYGLGIFRSANPNGKWVYTHGGTFFGFLTENMVDINSGVCISVLSNQDSINNGGLTNLYVAALHKIILNGTLGIQDVTQSDNIKVYPNPANDILNISSKEINNQLEIYDLVGKVIFKEKLLFSDTKLSLIDIPSGVYMVHIKNENGVLSYKQKIIVTH